MVMRNPIFKREACLDDSNGRTVVSQSSVAEFTEHGDVTT